MGLFIVTQTGGNWQIVRHTLTGQSLTSIAVSDGVIVAGTAEGIWRSSDNGQTWEEANTNLTIRHVRWITATSQIAGEFLTGTEPAGIFVSRDGAITWRPKPEVAELRDRHGWFLPYSPEAGCVRGFAVASSAPNSSRIYKDLFAVLSNGELWFKRPGESKWHHIFPEIVSIRAIAASH
jgi:hypothetical protein